MKIDCTKLLALKTPSAADVKVGAEPDAKVSGK